mgnify:CR=1 FL=1|jgi:hypothetical protein
MVVVSKSLCMLAAVANSVLVQSESLMKPTQDEDPEVYLNRSIEALGGAENISRVKSVSLLGPRYCIKQSFIISIKFP